MRIGIDARLYGPRVAKGLGRYVEQIVSGLVATSQPEDIFIVFLTADNWADCPDHPQVTKVLAPVRWYSFGEQLRLPRLFARYPVDLMHFPHFNVPLGYRGRFVVTVHDVILRRFHSRRVSTRGWLAFGLKKIMYRLVVWSALRRAAAVVTVSQFTKKELCHFYPWVEPKITVIPEGVASLVAGDTIRPDRDVKIRYTKDIPFILYVGNAYPHKNLERLVAAWEAIQNQWPGRLVFVGAQDYFSERLQAAVVARGLAHRIDFLGYVPDAELAQLYRAATAYVFPSLYEGFGLPPLEAMAADCPVVCSDHPCLREVCGDAAEYFNPTDHRAIAAAVLRVVQAPERQNELRQRGRERLVHFQWPEAVAAHYRLFTSLVTR